MPPGRLFTLHRSCLAIKWPGGAWLFLLGAHKIQECFHVSFCVARFGNRGRLLQLFQARTSCCDLCQAFFQRLFGRGFLLQSAGPRERVKLGGRPQSAEQRLRFRVLQEFVVGAPCVHCCTIGCDCSRTSSDCSDGTSTKCVHIQKVLTVDHNEIDEGNNLTDVGHSATNVNSAKRLRDALEHCNGRTEGARLALVHVHRFVDGKPHVRNVGCNHTDIHTALHAVANCALSNEQTTFSDSLISEHADLGGGQ
mmetsp:Transcript_122073/g.171781  ORF Transcript_122073/g.171781 Transcript_122073/m.171781 type:complete len:252 (+) Transcript_122073:289-1044(+)